MKNDPRLFVVIHTVASSLAGEDHAISQTAIAQENGAAGVILIPDYAKGSSKRATHQDQLLYLKALKENYPNFSIGANFLRSLEGIEEKIYSLGLNVLQTDDSRISMLSKEKMPNTELFCALAFKYSNLVDITGPRLQAEAERIAKICDVPTTSGNKTGMPPDIQKIVEIRSYLPTDKRLAIASGIANNNIRHLIHAGATDFLVASSLIAHVDELGRDILHPEKVSEIVTMTYEYL